jgi:hypothetical protein
MAVAVIEDQSRVSRLAEIGAATGHGGVTGSAELIDGRDHACGWDNIAVVKAHASAWGAAGLPVDNGRGSAWGALAGVVKGQGRGGGTARLAVGKCRGSSIGSFNSGKAGSRSARGAVDVVKGAGGDWAAHGKGSDQENNAAIRLSIRADRSITQAPVHHGFL